MTESKILPAFKEINPYYLTRISTSRRAYNFSNGIVDFAIDRFRKRKSGLTYKDLMDAGTAVHKYQAQQVLKYQKSKGNLFTIKNKKPQEYFPTKIKSEVIEKLAKRNTPIEPTGVTSTFLSVDSFTSPLSQCLQSVAIQTLEGYVLPLLLEAPLFVHNMHFKTKISRECYNVLKLPNYRRNKGKHHQEIMGKTLVDYIIYKSGTVDIQTTCSNNPYKLETEEDRFRIIEFFGQLRAELIKASECRYLYQYLFVGAFVLLIVLLCAL